MKKWLFQPFTHLTEGRLLLAGSVALVSGTGLAFLLNTRFDGALDIHFGTQSTLRQALADQVVALVSLVLFLLIAGWLVNKKTRPVDVLATVLIARIPFYFAALMNSGNWTGNAGREVEQLVKYPDTIISTQAIVVLIISVVVVLLLVVWSVALLWNGYKVAANAKGTKAVLLFIGALLLAELTSKGILYSLQSFNF